MEEEWIFPDKMFRFSFHGIHTLNFYIQKECIEPCWLDPELDP